MTAQPRFAWIPASALAVAIVAAAAFAAAGPVLQAAQAETSISSQTAKEAEARVLAYVKQSLRPGQPLIVGALYEHFTQPAERQALGKLYSAFFRIPLFVAQYQQRFRKPPTLKVIDQQFDLEAPGAANVLLSVMESDPRVPRFISRDPRTHEITRVDVKAIESNPRFGTALAHQLAGWEGRAAPAFELERLEGGSISSAGLRGKVYLLYVWFTGCPPCMRQTPVLESLMRDDSSRGFTVVGANADRVLKLGYSDSVRQEYARKMKISFPLAMWTPASDQAYGNIAIFPTLFLIGRQGIVRAHWVGYTPAATLQASILKLLAAP